MTTVNVGSVIRARATFRDGGKLFDPRFVVVDAVSPGGTRRLTTSTGEVTRESIGVYSALVPVGAGPTLTVRFSDGRDLLTEQKFDVVAKLRSAPPSIGSTRRRPLERGHRRRSSGTSRPWRRGMRPGTPRRAWRRSGRRPARTR